MKWFSAWKNRNEIAMKPVGKLWYSWIMSKPEFPPELDKVVLSLIPTGHHRAIRRKDLLTRCQQHQPCSDTEMRLAIQALRESGHMICNMEDGAGYFFAETKEEVDQFLVKYTARAASVFAAKDAMLTTAHRTFDYHPTQEKLFDVQN